MGCGTVVPPPSLLIMQHSPVLTLKWSVWSYGVWYCCAPSRPLDPAAFSRFDEGVEGMVLRGVVRGVVLLCPLPLS